MEYCFKNNPLNTVGTEIYYTSIDGNVITATSALQDLGLITNTYKNGTGILQFSGIITNIPVSAFSACTDLVSINIPDSITNIDTGSFEACSNLASVTVDSNNTIYDSRNECNAIIETSTNTLIVGCENTVIPDSVTSIGENAFSGCSGLTSINIPDSVTSIGNWAFQSCTGLTSITIPNSITSIGAGAFQNCSGLTSVTIPSSVTSIGDRVFNSCTCLTSVTIPSSVTSIGDRVFEYCTSLTELYIPSNITVPTDTFYDNTIRSYLVNGCTSLTSLKYQGDWYFSTQGGDGICTITALTNTYWYDDYAIKFIISETY